MIFGKAMQAPRASMAEQALGWDDVQAWFKRVFTAGELMESSQGNAEHLSPVAAAHRILCNDFGMIPFSLYRKNGDAREPVQDAGLDAVFKVRPSVDRTPYMLGRTVMSNAFWHGFGAVWNRRGPDGRIAERIPLPSDCCSIRQDPETGQYFYDYRVDGVFRTFTGYELSFLFFESYDGIRGRGFLNLARETIGAEGAAQQYGRKFYQNGAMISGIVEVDTDLGKEERDRVRSEFAKYNPYDDDAFKVHVHTDIPGAALTEAQKYGTLELAKIENMRTQAEDLAAGRHVQSTDDLEAVEEELENQGCAPAEPVKAAPEKEYGYVAVCAGAGLEAVFRDLGVDGIISGGQTMNPSTEDILREIDRTPAHVVYVLPNNKNIIMAAEQCVRLCEDKTVVVLPTKTVPQGIAAMLAVDPDAGREELTQIMTEAAQRVRTAEITYAARDSDFDGFAIKEGDYLALMEHQLFGTDRDLDALLDRLARSEDIQSAEFLSIFYGEDVTEEQAQEAAQKFTDACPNAEVNLLPGGQPVYYYMISAE